LRCGTDSATTSSSNLPAAQAAQSESVGGFAADGVVARQVLGGFYHSRNAAEARFGLRTFTAAFQPVVQAHAARALAPAHVGGVVLDVAHAFNAAGHDHIGRAGLHHHRGHGYGLQAAGAAAVQLHAGNLHREASLQRHPAPGARHFAVGVGMREDHVVDASRVQPGAGHHGACHAGTELFNGYVAQAAAECAYGCA
jgi:hypothetical protein